MIKDKQEASTNFKKQKNIFKAILIASVILLLIIMFPVIKILIDNNNENKSIDILKNKAYQIENKNKEISKMIQEYNTNTIKEKIAREDLNMMKDGEKVVVINDNKKEIDINQSINNKKEINTTPLYQKWLNIFFNKNRNNLL